MRVPAGIRIGGLQTASAASALFLTLVPVHHLAMSCLTVPAGRALGSRSGGPVQGLLMTYEAGQPYSLHLSFSFCKVGGGV